MEIPQRTSAALRATRAFAAVFISAAAAHRAHAATETWATFPQDALWSTPANWTLGAPQPGDDLAFGPSSLTALTNDLPLSTNISGIAFTPAAPGYTLSGAPLTFGGTITNAGPALQTLDLNLQLTAPLTFNTAPGNIQFNGLASGTLGLNKTGPGTLTLTGNNTYLGPTALREGTTLLSAGTITSSTTSALTGLATITVGGPGQRALFDINGGHVAANQMGSGGNVYSFQIANGPGAVAAVRLRAGTLYAVEELWLGNIDSTAPAYAALTQTGGTITSGFFIIGQARDYAAYNLKAGVLNVINPGSQLSPFHSFIVGGGYLGGGKSTAVANLTGGTVNITNPTGFGTAAVTIGEFGHGVLNISNDAILKTDGRVMLGNQWTNSYTESSGMINFRGGTLTAAGSFRATAGATATGPFLFNFHGGTFRFSSGAQTNTTISGLTGIRIYSAGAVIDDGNLAATITHHLLPPSGNGLAAVASSGGTNFLDTPVVHIARGPGDTTGTGAAAVADLDDAGNLIGISITNPGTDYTLPPVVTLLGGGGTGASITHVALAPNGPGGPLTKRGAGTLSLTAGATIHGPTNIAAGLLSLNTANAATVTSSLASIAGSGSLRIMPNHQLTSNAVTLGGTWTIAGTHTLRPALAGTASAAGTLTIAGAPGAWTGTLDLTANALVVQPAGPADKAARLATLQSQLASGKNGGDWKGKGLTSSTVALDAALTLALADNADLGLTTFRGLSVDALSLIVVQTRFGDATLDGRVDAFDLNLLASHWQQPAGALWSAGDFTGDGKVDAFDLNALAANWQVGAGGSLEATLAAFPELARVVMVPEPSTLALLSLVFPLLMRGSRRPVGPRANTFA